MVTRIRASQIVEDTLEDKDGDTKVTVEESSDEDKIRFDTAGSQRMIIDEAGQVGIGTDAPEEQFHIHGSNATLRLGNGINSGEHSPKIQFSELADTNGDMAYGYSAGYNGTSNNFEIKRHNNNVSGIEVLTANRNTGDIGIKTASPEADLHVYGGNSGQTFANVTFAVENDGSSDSFYAFQTATAGAGKSFSITNSGKVGIGSTSPTEILTLDATEPTILFKEGGTDMATIGINSSDNILIENKTMNKHIVFKVNDQGAIKEGFRLDGAVPEVVVNQTSDSLVDFRVESDNQTHMLFVDGSADKIGIKTNQPELALDINDNAIRIRNSSTPSSASDLGVAGEIRWDVNYVYVCVATDTWKRAAIGTW